MLDVLQVLQNMTSTDERLLSFLFLKWVLCETERSLIRGEPDVTKHFSRCVSIINHASSVQVFKFRYMYVYSSMLCWLGVRFSKANSNPRVLGQENKGEAEAYSTATLCWWVFTWSAVPQQQHTRPQLVTPFGLDYPPAWGLLCFQLCRLSVRPSVTIYPTHFVDNTFTLLGGRIETGLDSYESQDIEPWPRQGHVSIAPNTRL